MNKKDWIVLCVLAVLAFWMGALAFICHRELAGPTLEESDVKDIYRLSR